MYFQGEGSIDIPVQDIISWIFDEERYDIDKPVYIDASDTSRSISWRQARILVRQLAAGFKAAGLKDGDCVCLHSFNDIYYSILVLGIIAAGGIYMGTNPSYTSHELGYHLREAQVKFVISEPEMLHRMIPAAEGNGIPQDRIWAFTTRESQVPATTGLAPWTALLKHGEADWRRLNDPSQAKTTVVARLFSSGTTGLPKPVDFTHYNLIAQHTLVYDAHPVPFEARRILYLPFFHAAAAPSAHFSTLRLGDPSYVLRRFEPDLFLTTVDKQKITECTAVPPIIHAILAQSTTSKNSKSLQSLKVIRCGAAPLDKTTQARLQALLSLDATFTQVWGMTEASCIATMIPYPEPDDTGSVGRLLPGIEAKIIDSDGNDITAPDTTGEVCLRGPTIVRGYFNLPSANENAFDKDGFYRTGDLGYCDDKTKMWYLLDRKKDIIKVRGFQVAPAEVEGVLRNHPRIRDVAVVGVHDAEAKTEYPKAYVVREDQSLHEDQVKEYVAQRLAKYKRLDGGVRFVGAIPRNASGKILKRLLEDKSTVKL
ncbi:acyl--CoA ligase [Aspergillus neoniger CBS 115656]|uniref:AMP-binding enzyme n=1 Tax=Aspergillus neoniger (strain CBS 115656) TaxID=1448310 RepID=A0A318Y6U8_ASPNB|nr:AMP-binding enzyme [Aspergillus neoniger CBS 115656]PYH28470.1 AMP-binding enzyme [Aspergillus neoniger CBS 115656]